MPHGPFTRIPPQVAVRPEMWNVLQVALENAPTLAETGPGAFHITRFIASGEGSDLTNAFVRLLPELEGTISQGGGDVIIPYGDWNIDTGVVFNKPGVHLRSDGGYTATIVPSANVTGAAFRWAIPSGIYRGPQASNLALNMQFSGADGLVFESPYDNAILSNIDMYGLHGSQAGIKILPAVGEPIGVGQGVIATNVNATGVTGYTGNAWHIDRLQESVFLGCKGICGGEGLGTSFYIANCRGLGFYTCSAAISNIGWRILANARDVAGIIINNPTVESVTSTIDADGSATYWVSLLNLSNVRPEVAATIGAGPVRLDYVQASNLEVGSLTVTEAATCSQNHFITNYRPNVTSSGVNSSVLAWANAITPRPVLGPGFEVVNGNVVLGGEWNGVHLVMSGYHLWINGDNGKLYKKAGVPTNTYDGVVVGTEV